MGQAWILVLGKYENLGAGSHGEQAPNRFLCPLSGNRNLRDNHVWVLPLGGERSTLIIHQPDDLYFIVVGNHRPPPAPR